MQSCLNISAHKMSTSESSKFCAGELWNNNLTWYTDSPDFPTCFHKTILVYVPCAVLWLLSPIELKSNFSSNKRFVPWTVLKISKLICTSFLSVLALLELVRFALLSKNEEIEFEIEAADFVGSAVKLATFLFNILLILSGKRAGRQWLSRSGQSGHFRYQRTRVQFQSLANFIGDLC